MALVSTVYETDSSPRLVVKANVEQSTIDFRVDNAGVNSPLSAVADLDITAYMGAERTGYGIHARGVSIVWVGPAPTGYKQDGLIFIPMLRLVRYRRAMIGATGEYLGESVLVVGKRPETIGV